MGHYITYLQVRNEVKLNLQEHLDYARENVAKVSLSLARMMPNIKGSKYSRPPLIAEVVKSILLYAALVWAEDSENVMS